MVRTLALYQNGEFALNLQQDPSEFCPREEVSDSAQDSPRSRSNSKGCFGCESRSDTERYAPPRRFIYEHIYCYLQPLWVVLLQITHCAEATIPYLPPYISRIGMFFLVTVSKHECLIVPQVYSTRIWCPASNSGSIQGSRVVEA